MNRLAHSTRIGGALVAASVIAGCASATATSPRPAPPAHPATSRPAAGKPVARIAGLTTVAQRRYRTETHGGVAFGTLHRVGRDATLLRDLRSGNIAAARAYASRTYPAVWYHWHVSRMRVVRGSQILLDAGVPFVVAPVQMQLPRTGGMTLQVSIQDEIGFVRFMHRNYPVDIVVRGRGPGHIRSSLSAAGTARLPASGTAQIAGRRYQVRSFPETALGGEPVTVWVLSRG